MELRDRYIYAISRFKKGEREEEKEDAAMLDDMKFALEFMKFSGRSKAPPRDVAALAKVAEFYRKRYMKKPGEETPIHKEEAREEEIVAEESEE